jgi:hypothetical protein
MISLHSTVSTKMYVGYRVKHKLNDRHTADTGMTVFDFTGDAIIKSFTVKKL